jgi:hypothetical protein
VNIKDVIDDKFLNIYKDECDAIHGKLVFVKNGLFVVEKILDFPFDLFTEKDDRFFWKLTLHAFFDSMIMSLWTIIQDTGDPKSGTKTLTLRHLRNKARTSCEHGGYQRLDINADVKRQLKDDLESVYFEKRIRELIAAITRVRNRHIAHFDYDTQMGLVSEKERVEYGFDLRDLQKTLEIAYALFCVLTFDNYYLLEFPPYHPSLTLMGFPTDIDKLLDSVALRSGWFRELEHDFLIEERRARIE